MTIEQIHVAFANGESSCLMDGEILDTLVKYHAIDAGNTLSLEPCKQGASVLLIETGSVKFIADGFEGTCGSGVFVPKPQSKVQIVAVKDSRILELQRFLTREEFRQYENSSQIPFLQAYEKAPTYTEDCKSAKTISRMLIPQRMIPRFAMGSVYTYGDDCVEAHEHPMLEQFFFSLPENNCTVSIDGLKVPFPGNALLHIPLGSLHGVESKGPQIIHYVWMDFLFGEEGLKYMDEAHRLSVGNN